MHRRSFLFVPANRPDRLDNACNAGADVVVVDLEDAVAPAEKDTARATLEAWLDPAKPVYVRMNAVDTKWFADDRSLLKSPAVIGVMLPKAETAAQIDQVFVSGRSNLRIVPLVETALGLWRVEHRESVRRRIARIRLDRFPVRCGHRR